MEFGQINWVAWVLGGVAFMALGFLWYGPLFGKPWLAIMEKKGRKAEQMRASPGMYVLALLCSLVASYVLAVIIRSLGITEWWSGLIAGGVLWIGIGAAAMLTNSIFESEPKGLWVIFSLYELVMFAGLGVVFAVWR
jgi:hypothetical protein